MSKFIEIAADRIAEAEWPDSDIHGTGWSRDKSRASAVEVLTDLEANHLNPAYQWDTLLTGIATGAALAFIAWWTWSVTHG